MPAVEVSPDEALRRLVAGNRRYAALKSTHPHASRARRTALADGQHPFATIFGCIDSRVPPELVFDQGLGDLFVIRTGGEAVDDAVVGSIEYGAEELHIPLILVLGHESCGAVKATIETLKAGGHASGDIDYLVRAIAPAVKQVEGKPGDELDNAVRANALLVAAHLRRRPILAKEVKAGKLKIEAGRYDLDTGLVELL